jgi:hypothetical protein
MSADSQPEDNPDPEYGAIAFAFSESGPSELPSAIAIRALSIRTAMRSKTNARGVPFNQWDDTGESMVARDAGVLATGDENDQRPPSD